MKKLRWVACLTVMSMTIVSTMSATLSKESLISNADSSPSQGDLVLIKVPSEKQQLISSAGLKIIERYSSFVFASCRKDELEFLRDNGIDFDFMNEYKLISIAGKKFDPLREGKGSADCSDIYIVQFTAPIKEEWKTELMSLGATIYYHIPYNAFIMRMRPETKNVVEKLNFVRWVGPYLPEYKCGQNIHGKGLVTLTLQLYPSEKLWQTMKAIGEMGGKIIASSSNYNKLLRVQADSSCVPRIAAIPSVFFIEEWFPPSFLNAAAQWVTQSGVQDSRPIWAQNIYGDGQIVGVCDTGVDYDHVAFRNVSGSNDPNPQHRKIIFYKYYQSDSGDYYSHGTHTAGTIAGNNTPFISDPNNGMAPSALLSIDDVSANGEWNAPADLNDMYIEDWKVGARMHSNSWGWPVTNNYHLSSSQTDQFMWNHPDFLIVFAAGNEGPTQSTLRSPGTSKNVVTVGATGDGTLMNDMAQYIGQYFSSRGPTDDGRMKPTVCAPGEELMSAESDADLTTNNQGYVQMSGTSMATPTTAGCAALVRQYFMDGYYPTGVETPSNGFTPTAALMKAVLMASGEEMTGQSTDALGEGKVPNNSQGWGRVLLDNALYFNGDAGKLYVVKNDSVMTGTSNTYNVNVQSASEPFKVILVWTDYWAPANSNPAIVNNLELEVTSPTGKVYRGNNFQGINPWYSVDTTVSNNPDNLNVEEGVILPDATHGLEQGDWTIKVTGVNVAQGPQCYAVAVTGDIKTQAPGPSITMDGPNGGEVWYIGYQYRINWTVSGNPPFIVNLTLSTDGGSTYPTVIAQNINQGASGAYYYDWQIPSSITPSTQCRIKGEVNGTAFDASDNDFEIRLPPTATISVAGPNGGETWWIDYMYQVNWTVAGGNAPYQVSLYLSTDGGGTYPIQILNNQAQATPGNGQHQWLVPTMTPSNTCRIKAVVNDSSSPPFSSNDVSDSNFVIKYNSPNMLLFGPNGGQVWYVGYKYTINWTVVSGGTPPYNVNLSLSTDGGNTYPTLIVSDIPQASQGQNSYEWTIPLTVPTSTTCKVKVSADDSKGVRGEDESNSVFTIKLGPPAATLTSPNGGEKWFIGLAYQVTWIAGGGKAPYTIKLYFSSNSGTTFMLVNTTIQSNAGNNEYLWTIPGTYTPSTTCRMKVEAIDSNSVSGSDTSDSNFEIKTSSSPLVVVLSPNGGEKWYVGMSYKVNWSVAGGTPGYTLVIKLSTDGGTTYSMLTTRTQSSPGTGFYNWRIPATLSPSPTCRIKIEVTDKSSPPQNNEDASDADFEIKVSAQVPAISIMSPSGGEEWFTGDDHNVSWSVQGGTPGYTIDLFYSTDGGVTFSEIVLGNAQGGTGPGNFVWTVPDIQSSIHCKIRAVVKDSNNKNSSDTSQEFKITRSVGSIHGQVLDDATNQPLADVKVTVYKAGSSVETRGTTTLSDGTYRIQDLPVGDYDVMFLKEGYRDGWVRGTHLSVQEDKKVDIKLKQSPIISMDMLFLIAGIIVAILITIILLAVILATRKRKKAEATGQTVFQTYPSDQQMLRRYLYQQGTEPAPPQTAPMQYPEAQQPIQPQQGQPTQPMNVPVQQLHGQQPTQQLMQPQLQYAQAGPGGEMKQCKRCGTLNERWRLSCQVCKSNLGG